MAARGVAPVWDSRVGLAVVAGCVGTPSMGLLYRAMRDGSPALVASVAAVAALVPVAWGLLHGEVLGWGAGLGVVSGLAGVTMAGWPVPGAGQRRTRQAANLCALGAALGFGIYFVLLLNRSVLRERLHTVHLYGVLAAVLSVACLAR